MPRPESVGFPWLWIDVSEERLKEERKKEEERKKRGICCPLPLVVFAGRLRKSVALDAASPAIAAGGAGELRIVVLDCLMVGATARRHEPGH